MRISIPLIVACTAFILLTACGDTVPEQALIGAGAGAGTAAILDGSVGAGAVLGAAGNVTYCQLHPGRC